jgi:hypothetical protein
MPTGHGEQKLDADCGACVPAGQRLHVVSLSAKEPAGQGMGEAALLHTWPIGHGEHCASSGLAA